MGMLARLSSSKFPTELRSSGQSSGQGLPSPTTPFPPGQWPARPGAPAADSNEEQRASNAASIRATETVGYATLATSSLRSLKLTRPPRPTSSPPQRQAARHPSVQQRQQRHSLTGVLAPTDRETDRQAGTPPQ